MGSAGTAQPLRPTIGWPTGNPHGQSGPRPGPACCRGGSHRRNKAREEMEDRKEEDNRCGTSSTTRNTRPLHSLHTHEKGQKKTYVHARPCFTALAPQDHGQHPKQDRHDHGAQQQWKQTIEDARHLSCQHPKRKAGVRMSEIAGYLVAAVKCSESTRMRKAAHVSCPGGAAGMVCGVSRADRIARRSSTGV